MGKAIDLSLKAIKVTVEPYIGQTGNLVWWIRFFLILPFQYQQGQIYIPHWGNWEEISKTAVLSPKRCLSGRKT